MPQARYGSNVFQVMNVSLSCLCQIKLKSEMPQLEQTLILLMKVNQ